MSLGRPFPRRTAGPLALALALLCACGSSNGTPGATALGDVPRVVLTHHVTDLARLTLVVPSGALSGDEIKAHSHFRTDGSAVPLYAPVAMTLTHGAWGGPGSDYALIFQINARYRLILGHVTAPRADIASRLTVPMGSLHQEVVPLALAAGEMIGSSSGTIAVNGIDFGLYDLALESDTPNTPRYRAERFWQKLSGVCPYDYFADGLKPAYAALFGSIGGLALPGAPCRSLADQSAAGAIAGEWTLTSHPPDGTYQRQFGLGTHLGGGTVRIAGIGGTFDVVGGVDPKTVTTEICYVSGGNYVWLRRTSPTTLDAVFGAGVCPATFPAGSHRSYER